MPINYLNFQVASVAASGSQLYTPTTGAQATVVGLLLANAGTTSTTATVTLYNGSSTTTNIVKNVVVYSGTSVDVINSSKLIVPSGYILVASSGGTLDATLSVIEIT